MVVNTGKGSWVIWVLVVVAVVFVVLALKKERPAPVAPVTQDVLADKLGSVQGTIKPPHTEADQAAVKEVKAAVSGVVIPPQVVEPKQLYAIQVYSFKDKVRADTALLKLQSKGFTNSYVMVSDLGARGVWYRVRVGSFSNEGEAQAAMDKVITEFKSGILVRE